MLENEQDLLRKAREGQVDAFEKLIQGYQKKVFNLVFKMMGNYEDANELTQEVFIKVFRSIGSFKEEASFSTWLYRIATNVCLDEIRKRKRKNKMQVSLDEEILTKDGTVSMQIADTGPTPESLLERKVTQDVIRDAIRELPEIHRAIILLREIQGLSYEQISEIIQCPGGTVKSRINRARMALKEILKTKKELFSEDYVN